MFTRAFLRALVSSMKTETQGHSRVAPENITVAEPIKLNPKAEL